MIPSEQKARQFCKSLTFQVDFLIKQLAEIEVLMKSWLKILNKVEGIKYTAYFTRLILSKSQTSSIHYELRITGGHDIARILSSKNTVDCRVLPGPVY